MKNTTRVEEFKIQGSDIEAEEMKEYLLAFANVLNDLRPLADEIIRVDNIIKREAQRFCNSHFNTSSMRMSTDELVEEFCDVMNKVDAWSRNYVEIHPLNRT